MDNNSRNTKGHYWALAMVMAILVMSGILLFSVDRTTLRRLIDLVGQRDKSKPSIYHDYEGYSPGLHRSRVDEEFTRYHYYIAPDESPSSDPEPDIYFRQDYDDIEPQVTFDEEQYWREHPLNLDEASSIPSD